MKLDKAELRDILNALDDQEPQSAGAAALGDFLSKLRRQMDDGDVVDISAIIEG
jgi:hypothetical protein